MRVGEHNPLDAVVRGVAQSVQMSGNSRARIHHPAPDDVRIRAVQGEDRRVVGAHADDALGTLHAEVSTGVSSPKLGSQMSTGDTAWERRAFPLALAAMAVVVIVDLSVDTFALLIQLLLVGPLIAATGATVRQTIVVAVVALVVSIPLVAGTTRSAATATSSRRPSSSWAARCP